MPSVVPPRIRIVTATSLFDGHDAAINIMRRILQSRGAEIIHLGHNRSVHEIVECAIEEDAHAVAITSYQGGHLEFFRYLKDLLQASGCGHIKIFGGGGGTILPAEIAELHQYGIERIYSPDDGRTMGLEGMIDDLLGRCGEVATRAGATIRTKQDAAGNRVPAGNAVAAGRTIPAPGSPAEPGNYDYWKAAERWDDPPPLNEIKDIRRVARAITLAEAAPRPGESIRPKRSTEESATPAGPAAPTEATRMAPVLGITGTGGSGKSSITDEILRRFLRSSDALTVAVISVDPSKKKSGGALLGDRIRMNAISHPRLYMRSLATRNENTALSAHVQEAIDICRKAGYELVILESAGVGQSDTAILDYCDLSLFVMTPEYGAATQLEKINMLDYADLIALNKSDKTGAADALLEVRRQYKRNHQLWTAKEEDLPIVPTVASQFNDAGVDRLFNLLSEMLIRKFGWQRNNLNNSRTDIHHSPETNASRHSSQPGLKEPVVKTQPPGNQQAASGPAFIIPPNRSRYLAEIAENNRAYDQWVNTQAEAASARYRIEGARQLLQKRGEKSAPPPEALEALDAVTPALDPQCRELLDNWPALTERYNREFLEYQVRHATVQQELITRTLSGTPIHRVLLPRYQDWGDRLRWLLQENVPGSFPYTAGVFELKRAGEDPTRMFAGEGGPERTNKRFHYLSAGQPASRLSTAFDSVTLYGEDPDERPDIFGKIGNAGVSIATVDDAKKLYSGFDLCSPNTSVSMTINGPAPLLLAFFMQAAIDQQCEKYIEEHGLWPLVSRKLKEKYGDTPPPVYQPFAETTSSGTNGNSTPRNNPATGTPSSDARPDHNDNNPAARTLSSDARPDHNDHRTADAHPADSNGNSRVWGLGLLGLSGDEVLEPEVYQRIRQQALASVRGTVQADILKEDQAQNTCIFSTEFALKMMGDVQQYFIDHHIRNFYSVSISGYHIAEAGANPITQLAFTLANGFTYLEYYLSRGMHIDDFAPNLSFFFSNGMDAEYSVIGRVARRIWAKAVKHLYKGNERSQKLKYHIQTSGRSLHAQEIDFNDIRTTLQALYAIYDNCNSLHTNAYDEAITTPTEESVRRAMAIQLIINRELGTAKNENPGQGSFLIEELSDLVEQAVLAEFDRLSDRGGVLGAMERMYQRNKIQEESLVYETRKHSGELPIVGVNTFLNKEGSATPAPAQVIRSSREEKEQQISNLRAFQARNRDQAASALQQLQQVAVTNGNIFAALMETVKYCSLGQITHALYEVGGQYRRNM